MVHILRIRELAHDDLKRLSKFMISAYYDYPLATWFEEEPTAQQIGEIFERKLHGIASHRLIDLVTDDNGVIAAECEVVKAEFDMGIVGVLVERGYRGRSVGGELLVKAMEEAVRIGMTRFTAEVDEENADAMKFFSGLRFVPIGYRDVEHKGIGRRIAILQRGIS